MEAFTFCGKFGHLVGDKERTEKARKEVGKQLRDFYAEW